MGRMSDEAIVRADELLHEDVSYREWSDGITRACEDDHYAALAEREEIRALWGGTLSLPTGKAGMRQYANGLLASIRAWDARQAEEDERIAGAWVPDPDLDAKGLPPAL